MRTAATPGEVAELVTRLEHVDPERRAAIVRLVFEVVADCPSCDEPVRRADARGLDEEGRLAHLACLPDPKPEDDPGSPLEEIAYETGCDCARSLPPTDIHGNERCMRCDRTREQPS